MLKKYSLVFSSLLTNWKGCANVPLQFLSLKSVPIKHAPQIQFFSAVLECQINCKLRI